MHTPAPSINVQPAVALDLLGVANPVPSMEGAKLGAVNPKNAPLSSISAASGQTSSVDGVSPKIVPTDLAERVVEKAERPNMPSKGPGGGPGSAHSGGGPPGSVGNPAGTTPPPQPLRILETHVDPSS